MSTLSFHLNSRAALVDRRVCDADVREADPELVLGMQRKRRGHARQPFIVGKARQWDGEPRPAVAARGAERLRRIEHRAAGHTATGLRGLRGRRASHADTHGAGGWVLDEKARRYHITAA